MSLMKMLPVEQKEFKEILKYLNVISVSFKENGKFYVLPIIRVNETSFDVLITDEEIKSSIALGKIVKGKTYRFGFEFNIKSSICEIKEDKNVISLDFMEIGRIWNFRQYIRYDVNLKGKMVTEKEKEIDIEIKDISLEGASIYVDGLDCEIDEMVNIEVAFDKGKPVRIFSRVLRSDLKETKASGVEFIWCDQLIYNNLKKELQKIEKTHLEPLNQARKYFKKSKKYDKKISIYSTDCDNTYYLSGLIFLMGIEKYTVYTDFRSYKDEVKNYRPDVIIIDVEKINDDILCALKYARENMPEIPVVMLLPYNFSNKIKLYSSELKDVSIVKKPVLDVELESCLRSLTVFDE